MKGFMSKIYLDVLDEPKQRVFAKLASFKRHGYLAGGTALALQIQHRRSFDFDVFVKRAVNNNLKRKVINVFGRVDFYVNTSDQISFKTSDDISVTFLWYYYPLLSPSIQTDSIRLACVNDIAADKAHTIGRRAVWRDYVDLFILLRRKIVTLKNVCEFAQKKFAGEFNEALFLEQLCYFKDITEVPVEFIKDSYTPLQIKSFLKKAVRAYIADILP